MRRAAERSEESEESLCQGCSWACWSCELSAKKAKKAFLTSHFFRIADLVYFALFALPGVVMESQPNCDDGLPEDPLFACFALLCALWALGWGVLEACPPPLPGSSSATNR
jgi:hypothetical protein